MRPGGLGRSDGAAVVDAARSRTWPWAGDRSWGCGRVRVLEQAARTPPELAKTSTVPAHATWERKRRRPMSAGSSEDGSDAMGSMIMTVPQLTTVIVACISVWIEQW